MGKFRTLIVALCILAGAALIGKFVAPRYLVVNRTQSMPIGFYFLSGADDVKRGDIVVVQMPDQVREFIMERRIAPPGTTTLIKHVVGKAGDEACTNGGVFVVSGVNYGAVKAQDEKGRNIPKEAFCGKIEPGNIMVGVSGDGSSYDSRYFGEIPASYVISKAVPILTFSAD